ncbi:MAG: asparagine synthase (glutamine-hydrolyzing) [Nitrospinae bacterium]|nr:asparagine synthase (glutamine-hydrolyzing) [Nitrospinota bacterium]
MCGIAGLFNYGNNTQVTEDLIIKMRDSMTHRGPDDAGIYLSPDKKVGLGHRRLSILDLSSAGRQPMCDSRGEVWIVYNGEVYNFIELRRGLEEKGYRFKSHSDTEVLIYLYKEYGREMVHRLRGMFAFAIYDEIKGDFFLARDRIGVKPLYYTFSHGSFIFASEIKALLEHPAVKREVNDDALYHYLSFLTTPPPMTLFKNIFKLPAGYTMSVRRQGDYTIDEYWDVFQNVTLFKERDERFYVDRILELLRESVKYRMISDVPFGVFLSGGIDSSTNVALMSELMDKPVETFSIGYKGNALSGGEGMENYNELQYARRIASEFKTNHHEILIDVKDFIDFLPSLIYHQDEPIADPVCVPVYYVAKLAKDSGVTVCQVGEGSDEIFFGYEWWIKTLMINRISKFYQLLPYPLRMAALKSSSLFEDSVGMRYEIIRRAAQKEVIFWGGAEAFSGRQKEMLLSDSFRDRVNEKNFYGWDEGGVSSYGVVKNLYDKFEVNAKDKDFFNWMSYIDLRLRLPELLLMRVDKMTMAASVEARVPFLDHKLVEFAMSIPKEIKIKNHTPKYILKKSVVNVIPHEIAYRRKRGFDVPITDWFMGELGDFTKSKFSAFLSRQDYFNKDYIDTLVKASNGQDKSGGKASLLWYLLNFVLWHERWIENNAIY